MKRLVRTRKLFGFLRAHRHEPFDEAFEFVSMYRDKGAGRTPVPPALLAMATLLQAYHGMSDAEAVEMTVVDLGGALYAPLSRVDWATPLAPNLRRGRHALHRRTDCKS